MFFVDGFISQDEKVASLILKSILNSRPEGKNHTVFLTKMAKIDALCMAKTAEKLIPSRAEHT